MAWPYGNPCNGIGFSGAGAPAAARGCGDWLCSTIDGDNVSGNVFRRENQNGAPVRLVTRHVRRVACAFTAADYPG